MEGKRWVLKDYPKGQITPDTFEVKTFQVPSIEDGQALVENTFISVDPYQRPLMYPGSKSAYSNGYKPGEPITGISMGKVLESKIEGIKAGDLVAHQGGWETHSVVSKNARKLPQVDSPELHLSMYGMTGLTAYFGLLDICNPKEGETVLVSAAAGAVGSIVGQLAKIRGCHVVGTTSSDEKGKFLKELGYDEVINYSTCGDLREAVKKACPKGIDVYFDNVGGELLQIAVELLNRHGRISLCGGISQYEKLDKKLDAGPNLTSLIGKEGKIQGFLVGSFMSKAPQAIGDIQKWHSEGKIKSRETVYEGFDKVPEAFVALFKSTNFGKIVIKL